MNSATSSSFKSGYELYNTPNNSPLHSQEVLQIETVIENIGSTYSGDECEKADFISQIDAFLAYMEDPNATECPEISPKLLKLVSAAFSIAQFVPGVNKHLCQSAALIFKDPRKNQLFFRFNADEKFQDFVTLQGKENSMKYQQNFKKLFKVLHFTLLTACLEYLEFKVATEALKTPSYAALFKRLDLLNLNDPNSTTPEDEKALSVARQAIVQNIQMAANSVFKSSSEYPAYRKDFREALQVLESMKIVCPDIANELSKQMLFMGGQKEYPIPDNWEYRLKNINAANPLPPNLEQFLKDRQRVDSQLFNGTYFEHTKKIMVEVIRFRKEKLKNAELDDLFKNKFILGIANLQFITEYNKTVNTPIIL